MSDPDKNPTGRLHEDLPSPACHQWDCCLDRSSLILLHKKGAALSSSQPHLVAEKIAENHRKSEHGILACRPENERSWHGRKITSE